MFNFTKVAATAAAIGVFAIGTTSAVEAATVSGSIEIGGAVTTASAGDLTGVDFKFDSGAVLDATGDFATGDMSASVSLTDIMFNTPGAVWSWDVFSFVATGYSDIAANLQGGKDFTASGVLSGTGFDDTTGSFLFSSQSNGTTASFSSSTAPTPVPLPAGLPLLLVGLGGLGVMARKKKA
jgi:hypothetical protein